MRNGDREGFDFKMGKTRIHFLEDQEVPEKEFYF